MGIKQRVLQTSREAVADILEVRFDTAPPAIAEAIHNLDDLSHLKKLHRKVATVGSMDEFGQFLDDLLK